MSVSPAAPSLFLGATQQFTATVSGTTNTAVTWRVNGVVGGNATTGTISAGGLYTTPQILPSPVTLTVSAASAADPSKSGSATVTVQSDVTVAVMPTPASVELGARQQFTVVSAAAAAPTRP